MATTVFPANLQEFLTFLPRPPRLDRNPLIGTTTEAYTAHDILTTPEDQPILSRLDHTLIPRLTQFISSVVVDFDIGDVSCQSMLQGLQLMRGCRIEGENNVSLYGEYATRAIDPIVHAIAEAAHIDGEFTLHREPVTDLVWPQKCDCFTFTLVGQDDAVEEQDIRVCSNEDTAYSVLLSKAEELSQSIRLDVTTKQEGATAMAINSTAFFPAGFIAIAAQLGETFIICWARQTFYVSFPVRSTDVSHPGHILLLPPAFRLPRESLVHPDPNKELTQFEANIQPEPFLAIIVAMISSKLLPGHWVADPPPDLLLPQLSQARQDAEGGQEGNEEDSPGGDETDPSDPPTISLQVATNAMVSQHPWLRSSDVHRISMGRHPTDPCMDLQNIPTASYKNSGLVMEDPLLSLLQQRLLVQLCRRSPHVPSTSLEIVTLVSQIRASHWSTVWTCSAENHEEPFIIKLVPETHSDMIWKEFYMYEVVLKECPLVPKFYGMFQRPVSGWFAFCLEDLGDNLETTYDLCWSGVKRSIPEIQWLKLLESVKQLHSLGVLHGDLEPRNVAQTAEGFKFFDFGHSQLHHCQFTECDELQNLLSI